MMKAFTPTKWPMLIPISFQLPSSFTKKKNVSDMTSVTATIP